MLYNHPAMPPAKIVARLVEPVVILCIASFLLFLSILMLSGCKREGKFRNYPVIYDFIENFPLTEVQDEPTLVDLGTPVARRHLLSGWSLDEKWPGYEGGSDMTMVWGVGEKSVFGFFVREGGEIQMVFRCLPFRFPGSPSQVISIEINGQEVRQVALDPKLKEYNIVLPRETVRPGKNRLEFRYAYARAPIEVLPPGSKDRRRAELAVGFDYIRFSIGKPSPKPRADAANGVLYIPFGARVDYYLRLPQESAVTLEGLMPQGDPAGQLRLLLQREGEEEKIVGNLQASAEFRAIPLPGDSARIVRVSFQAVASSQASASKGGVALVRPAIRSKHVPNDAHAGDSSRSSLPADGTRKPNVIIYLIDALRADHLGCYGYETATSPNIDALAKDAILFENAIAQSSWTRTSVASIFTGLYPKTHGVKSENDALPSEATTLAEILRAAGYRTAAFVANSTVGKPFGFNQGFVDSVYFDWKLSDAVNKQAFAWLEAKTHKQPFFLYVHTIDPHAPYGPPRDFREQFAAGVRSIDIGSVSNIKKLHQKKIPVTQTLIADLVSLYDAEIAFNDHNFGSLMKELRKNELYEETLIIFVSDHGEQFYEHEAWEHTTSLHREVLHVPLMIKLPSSGTGGQRIAKQAQHIDILPTILDYLGLDIPTQVEGRSLLVRRERDGLMRRSLSYVNLYGVWAESVREGRWKLMRQRRRGRQGTYLHLYDQQRDPDETVNLIEKHPVVAGYLLSLMQAHEQGRLALKPAKAMIDEELRQKLKALGYAQ